jgi:S1-C subfamily serine protease
MARRRARQSDMFDRCRLIALSMLLLGAAAATAAANLEGRVKSGTGFAVSPLGYIVTGAHVVTACREVSVWAQGSARPARVVASDVARDVALLRVGGAPLDYVSVPPPREIAFGEPVLALGYGVHVDHPRTPEAAIGTYVGSDLTTTGTRVYVLRARLHPGDSGSAVLGRDGALVGMVIGRDTDHPDRGLVLPASEIGRFLRRHGVWPAPATASEPPAAETLLLAISNLVQCVPR